LRCLAIAQHGRLLRALSGGREASLRRLQLNRQRGQRRRAMEGLKSARRGGSWAHRTQTARCELVLANLLDERSPVVLLCSRRSFRFGHK